MSKYISLKIKEVVKETPDSITIHFKQPLFKKVKYTPGQFLTLMIPVGGKMHRRSYSICTAPNLDSTVAVTVKRVEGGIVSNYLNDTAKEGDKIDMMEPMGTFTLEAQPSSARHIVLLGAGSGITPLMSMLKTVLYQEKKSRVSLIFSCKDEHNIIFKKTLEQLENQFSDRLTVTYFLSQSTARSQGLILSGRASAERINEVLNSSAHTSELKPQYFVCGPDGFMQEVFSALEQMGVSKNDIRKESFYAAPTESSSDMADVSSQNIEITLNGLTHEVTVGSGKKILDAALELGLDMPFSCQSGVCTACRGKLVQGSVHMDTQDALTDSEIEQGYILTCQAVPTTADVRIDMNA